jgi:glycerol kinase
MSGNERFVLAIDQGTSGTIASLCDRTGHMVASVDVAVRSIFPASGWVEQDPHELLESIREAVGQLISSEGLQPGQIDSVGVANQGECLLLWDVETGEPVYNMIGWQCVRSADLCRRMMAEGFGDEFRHRTGLMLEPTFPATKMVWMVENVPAVAELLRAGRLAFSQSDSWFIHHLTKERLFVTDHSTASRSGFYNVRTRDWDEELIDSFRARGLRFPQILDSADYFGELDLGDGWQIPWKGNALDQPAALLGQACLTPGDTKVTYGTCASLWHTLGASLSPSKHLDTSVAWQLYGQPMYAILGEYHSAGASLTWLRDRIGVQWSDAELSQIASSAGGQEELVVVAALSGLCAPHWVPEARGTIYGLTDSTGPGHLVRASLEGIAFAVRDLTEFLTEVEGRSLPDQIKADGGMSANGYLMQFQADILGRAILVPKNREGTSAGVAFLAGLASGYYSGLETVEQAWEIDRVCEPRMNPEERERRYERWRRAVGRTIAMYTD